MLVLLLVGVVIYAGYIATTVANLSTNPSDLAMLNGDAAGRVNVLVLGDGDPGHAGEKLTDTMMVLSLDPATKRVAQISIPRDLRVAIPGYGSAKINSANAVGGVSLAEQVVSNTLGIPINYYVQTNFTGLKQLVDAVGGLDIDVKTRLYDSEYPCDNNQYKSCGLDIEPGLQHLDGARVLQYARCRKGTCGNDFGRAARQQEVLDLVKTKVVRWDVLLNPAKLRLIGQAVHSGIATDMGPVQMAQFGYEWQAASKNQPIHLVLSTSPGGYLMSAGGSSDLLPIGGDFSAIDERVQNIFAH
jgi:LCP family protein required for cell wall assembly